MEDVTRLFLSYIRETPGAIIPLPGSGSYRSYCRIFRKDGSTVIGVSNADKKENLAFTAFSRHFRSCGLPVPEVLAEDIDQGIYLLNDLGDETLFSFLDTKRKDRSDFPEEALAWYRKVVEWLPQFQVKAGEGLDYSLCYPRASFDRQSMMWDLSYFKYYFLKLAKVPFDEQLLEDDFNTLVDYLLKADGGYFMYRDFQSRNIMLHNNKTWFIDYQGGRKGPLQYDIASLLYDAKAAIPEKLREELLKEYLGHLNKLVPVDENDFTRFYYGFVLIRILQAFGAYGFRGYYENKPHFLQSIPHAMGNLKYLIDKLRLPPGIPVLAEILGKLTQNPLFNTVNRTQSNLTVTLSSFSYKKNIPADPSGNGGGFVFDCRSLPNPGRMEEFRPFTGKDRPVIDYLKREPEVDAFLNHVYGIVGQSVKRYIERDFTHLAVSFGCTGGQHRSVYCTEALAAHLKEKFPVKVEIVHTEIKSA
jgi:aminoglycoside/choline kinase family phosphotransferase